jgi:hypothetical protein
MNRECVFPPLKGLSVKNTPKHLTQSTVTGTKPEPKRKTASEIRTIRHLAHTYALRASRAGQTTEPLNCAVTAQDYQPYYHRVKVHTFL